MEVKKTLRHNTNVAAGPNEPRQGAHRNRGLYPKSDFVTNVKVKDREKRESGFGRYPEGKERDLLKRWQWPLGGGWRCPKPRQTYAKKTGTQGKKPKKEMVGTERDEEVVLKNGRRWSERVQEG